MEKNIPYDAKIEEIVLQAYITVQHIYYSSTYMLQFNIYV